MLAKPPRISKENKKDPVLYKKKKVMPRSQERSDKLIDICKKADDWYSYFSDHLDRARRILTFIDVDQWDTQVRANRNSLGKPVMTFNKIRPTINNILGEQRSNSPQPLIKSISDKNTQSEIDWRTDLIRQIASNSNSDMVYETAFEFMLSCGWGWVKTGIKYESEESFKKCLYLQELDYQSGFADPAALQSDKADGEYAGTITLMSREEYNRKYPDCPNPQDPGSYYYIQWNTRDVIAIGDIWLKEYHPVTIVELSDGRSMEKEKADEIIAEQKLQIEAQAASMQELSFSMEEMPISELEIVNERDTKKCKIKHYRFVRNYILEEADFPGKELPITYFEGKSAWINGEKAPLSYIEPSIDSQTFLNYLLSETAHSVLTSRKEQFMGTEENFEGYEDIYRNPQQNLGPLYANRDSSGSLPEVISPPPFNQSFLVAAQQMTGEIAQTLGRPDEARGYQTNAISGDAIERRQDAGKSAVNVYTDNLKRGIRQVTRVQLGLFPEVYGEDNREVTIRTAQGQVQKMVLNKRTDRFNTNDMENIKEEVENSVEEGNYDIEINVDGTFDQQVKDQLEALRGLYQVMPQSAQATIDLYGKLLSVQENHELVERLSTLLPPNIKALKEGKEPPPPQPNPMVMMEQGKLQAEMKNMDLKMQESQINAQVKMAEIEVSKEKLINERTKMAIDAKLQGIDATVTLEKAQAEILKTRIKSRTEIEKAHLDSGTAHITHATHRMKQMDKLMPENNPTME